MFQLQVGTRRLSCPRPLVMGILNVTPDSFSDGGRFNTLDLALKHVAAMIDAGMDIVDVGGESTRPGAPVVSVEEELARIIPVISAIRREFDVAISVDTLKAAVMAEALNHGVDLINDICALRDPGALDVLADAQASVCLMHMQGTPRTMQQDPQYQNVVDDVADYLRQRVACCLQQGIARQRLILDPGFGFGKTLQHNFQLLAALSSFSADGFPVLVGMSRKSMIGQLLERPVNQRLAGSLACAVLAAERGASIIRVHDVRETVDALDVWAAVQQEK